MSDNTADKVVLAFALGALMGAAVALLFAPAEGSETRELLTQKAREAREKAAEAARQGRDAFNKQRDKVSTAFDRSFNAAGEEQEQA